MTGKGVLVLAIVVCVAILHASCQETTITTKTIIPDITALPAIIQTVTSSATQETTTVVPSTTTTESSSSTESDEDDNSNSNKKCGKCGKCGGKCCGKCGGKCKKGNCNKCKKCNKKNCNCNCGKSGKSRKFDNSDETSEEYNLVNHL